MSISGDVNELNEINAEIKRVSLHLKNLRTRAKLVEERIVNYLREKDQPGVKFQGRAIILENKSKRVAKKKSQKEADALRILEDYGVHNPEKVLEEVLEARKGYPQEVQKLKIAKIKNKR